MHVGARAATGGDGRSQRRTRLAFLDAIIRFRWVVVVVALAALVAPGTAAATTWLVTNVSDPGNPGCDPGDCSLRAAITAADGGAGADLVEMPAGTYGLTAGVLPITKGMQILGRAGSAATTVDAQKTSGIFSISALAGAVTISGLRLENGLATGGSAVSSAAPQPLTLSGDVFTQNTTGGPGTGSSGAVGFHPKAPASLAVINSTFTANAAGGDGNGTVSSGQGLGGAIAFSPTSGTLSVSGSTFTNNRAGGNGGAGLSSAQGEGGAIEAFGEVTVAIANSSFTANRAGGNGGGGAASADGGGGAVEFFGESANASLSITGSTFASNEAGGSAGIGESSGTGEGGAVEAEGEGTAALTNDTFVENNANHGEGGAYATGLLSTLLNDTLAGNASTGGRGGNLAIGAAATTLTNTIIVGGAATTATNCSVVGGGLAFSAGHNLEDTTPSQCGLTATGDKVGANPLLGVLQNNGGPTATEALQPGSPAIDAGNNSGCPASDQRGALRPAGAACDIGAFEVATPAASTGLAAPITVFAATLNGIFTNPDVASGIVYFQYGTTAAYGSQTSAQPIGPEVKAPIGASVAGLAPGTSYHFRAVVTNAVGSAFGADQTFTTATTTPKTLTLAPSLTGLALQPSVLRAEPGKGASFTARNKVRGSTVKYHDSETAATSFLVQRSLRGYRAGRRCLARRPTHQHGKPHRCTLFVRVGSFTRADSVGLNHFHFTGRITGKPLRVGNYRLQAVARNASGQKSRTVTVSFRIVH